MYSILKNISYKELYKGKEFEIKGIEYDSRKIKENFVFVAMIGVVTDGHNYIQTAIDNGAKMVIVEKDVNPLEYINYNDVTFIFIENVRKHLGMIASNYYDFPQNKIKIIGITGTNGKTTSSYILENILEKTARIGTTGNRILDKEYKTVNTTPESLELIKLLFESVKVGVDYFIMEVSSHALETGRVEMLEFDSAIFTNLTQDHLDFHKTMENYFNAKKKIFKRLRKKGKGIVNIDDNYGKIIYNEVNNSYVKKENTKYLSISLKDENADFYGKVLKYTNDGMRVLVKNNLEKVNLSTNSKMEYEFNINLVGEYNLYNVLGCIASCFSLGIDMDYIIEKLEKMNSVPGRFETIKNDKNVRVVVDFAHTDDGLSNIGKTLKEITDNRVITIFGAGGDRDIAKRPKMAKAAAKFSDYIILTSDNPRTEDPMKILNQVEQGLLDINYSKEKYIVIEDREKAIKYAIEQILQEGDSLLIAGKGHETYQIIGKEKHHFDDREIAKKYLI